jgi:nucleotide-binding universal stress UspA family protein
MNSLFSTIVVGVDDSEPSKCAVALGARLAREHGGRLVLCNSVNWMPMVAQLESAAPLDPHPLIQGMKAQGDALVDAAVAAAKALGVAAERHTLEGDPAENIVRIARDEQAGAIVMGTHGRRGLGRLVMGSTTEAVLRASDIPVLTIREDSKTATASRRCIERVLVALDDSGPSDAAVEAVLELPADDRLHVVFTSVADVDSVIGSRGFYHYAMIRGVLCERAQCILDRALEAARAKGVAAEARVIEGTTHREILVAAQDEDADVIVMGSHGRRGLQRFFLGSVAERIIRTAQVPVLVVRRPAAVASTPPKAEVAHA